MEIFNVRFFLFEKKTVWKSFFDFVKFLFVKTKIQLEEKKSLSRFRCKKKKKEKSKQNRFVFQFDQKFKIHSKEKNIDGSIRFFSLVQILFRIEKSWAEAAPFLLER